VQTLSVNSVGKRFGGVVAVDDVSLTISTGEVLGLIGPNGSGKTTLLGCIAGTHTVSQGTVELGGKQISGLPAYQVARQGLSRSFQSVRLFSRLSVLENVKAAVAQHEQSMGQAELESRSMALLSDLRIADLAEREAGQQRRLEVARALASSPRFLLLDEPAAGMNEAETIELLNILRRLVRTRGIGMVIVDHDMHLIVNLCDRVAVLNKGQLIAEGAPLRITQNPRVQEAYLGRRAKKLVKSIQSTEETAK
jgi:branched-chain amino acid transport system permease protein